MVAGAPYPSTGLSATPGNGSATVKFTPPALDNASITSFTITANPGGQNCVSTTSFPCTVTGLTNGTSHTFTGTSTNPYDTSPASTQSAAATPRTVPSAPAAGNASAGNAATGNASALVSWTAPASNGAPITSYKVTSSPGAKTCTSATTSCTVSGLTNGTSYTFTVTATDAAGAGSPSAASAPVIPATVPTAPAGVTATLDTSNSNNYSWYSIGFTQGAGNGSPITQNSVTVTDLTNSHVLGPVAYAAGSPIEVAYANTADGTSTGAVVASRGDTLHFTVTVTNIVGTSTPSTAITAVLPVWTPLAPTGVSASAGDTAAAASWTASYNPPSAPAIASYIVTDGTGDTCTATAPASDGCSPVTGYTVVVVDQTTSTTTVVAGSSSLATVTGLTATDSYTFSVYATNVVGNSAASTPVQAVPRGPTSVTGTTLGDGTATISWTPSTVILGDAVTGFLVSSFDLTVLAAGPSVPVGSSTTTTTISGLTLGDQYDVCVSAQNSLSPLANETSSVCTA